MKITVEKADLQRATARVTSAVERRQTQPILANVKLVAAHGKLSITGTDLDIEVTETTAAHIEVPGEITVSASTLAEIARNAPNGAEIAISCDEAADPRATVRFGRSRYQLPVLPATDFPTREGIDGAQITMPAADLHRLFDYVHFAQSTEETRYYLNGTYLHPFADNGTVMLRTVATDSHRLAINQLPCADAAGMPAVIVPRKAVGEMRRVLAELKDDVTLRVSPKGIQLLTDTGHLITKTIDGAFPDYIRIVPTDWKHETEVDRALLKEAIKRVSLITAEKSRPIKFAIDDGMLTLSVRNMEAGVAHEELEVVSQAESFDTGFNAKYILDVLDQTDADRMLLRLSDPASPARLDPMPGTKHAEHIVNVVMPLRI
ncbi:DNA polymerase III subunit beta [Brevundimonas sp.]|uniref:DNA polymerase III subunit beta n=1 Tax=Brevundimonas sp. TaxID=1871086 RepID=UPI00289DEAEC|nr:DNA polymerase III subunit beta [Brevundimonas sp.]